MKRKATALGTICSIALLIAFVFPQRLAAQSVTITGTVRNSVTKEPIPSASVRLKESTTGSITNSNGHFTLRINKPLPTRIFVTHISYENFELVISSENNLSIELIEKNPPLNEVTVQSVDRRLSGIMNTSTSVERFGYRDINNSASPGYYNVALTKKNVDITTSGLLFNTISTRGFNGSGSTRVNQLVDGMDNQAPGLNFFVGNLVGVTELDVDNIEILPGASSALYGPGGMNGTILINSKDAFQHQGLSILARQGVMHVDKSQRENASPFYDYSLRWARAVSNRLALKMGVQYISAKDWLANDSSNYSRSGNFGKIIPGTRQSDPNYDGVNVYGDETSLDVRRVNVGPGQWVDLWAMVGQGIKLAAPPLSRGIDSAIALSPSKLNISRTGYAEKDVIDPETKDIKLSGAIQYKLTDKLQAQLVGYWATGSTVYTGNNRYVLKDVKIGQYKFELKHPNWFLRAYTTQENAGDAHTATVTTQYFNEAWKPSGAWYQQYAQGYLVPAATVWTQTYVGAMGAGHSDAEAAAMANSAMSSAVQNFHTTGRTTADQGRPVAGSETFKHLFDSVSHRPISEHGGLFLEKSQLWMTEGQYDFTGKIKFADIIVGANLKKYILDSDGTLFIDQPGHPIRFNEMGSYAQVSKRFFNERLALSISGRYDKNEDFKGHFTPRTTALLKIAKNQNMRASYQTAYRFPSTQQKYIDLDVGDYTLLGGLPWVLDSMHSKANPVIDLATGQSYEYKEFKPENSRSFEVGYKGFINKKLLIDAYLYFGAYENFLGRNVLFQPSTGNVYSTVVNSSTNVKSHGFGLGIDYNITKSYSIFANAYSDVITDVPTGFQSYFNTPKYRMNAGISSTSVLKSDFGFNLTARWQDAFSWDGELANGPVNAFTSLDAQVNYKFKKLKSMIKVGGSNIFNHYYKNAYANPSVGGLYYVSYAFNVL